MIETQSFQVIGFLFAALVFYAGYRFLKSAFSFGIKMLKIGFLLAAGLLVVFQLLFGAF